MLPGPLYCTYSFIQFKPVPAVLGQAKTPLKPQEFCLHQDCRNNLPATTVSPKTFFTFIALDNRGKSSKENQPPAWASQAPFAERQAERTHRRTDTQTHARGLCPPDSPPQSRVGGSDGATGATRGAEGSRRDGLICRQLAAEALCRIWGRIRSFQPLFSTALRVL